MAKKGKRKVRRGGGGGGMANPPPYKALTSFRRKFRYTVTTAFASGTLSETQLLVIPGTMCTVTNTTVVAMQVSVKLHAIRIWGAAPAAGNVSTVGVRWIGAPAAAANWHAAMQGVTDTSVNPANSPHIVAVPPAGSAASFWLSADNSGADTVLAIEAPVSSVIEFDMEFNHGMPPAVGAFTFGVATGTLGVMYWPGLNASAGTGQMYPVALATTI